MAKHRKRSKHKYGQKERLTVSLRKTNHELIEVHRHYLWLTTGKDKSVSKIIAEIVEYYKFIRDESPQFILNSTKQNESLIEGVSKKDKTIKKEQVYFDPAEVSFLYSFSDQYTKSSVSEAINRILIEYYLVVKDHTSILTTYSLMPKQKPRSSTAA
jgi:hypothetical protein